MPWSFSQFPDSIFCRAGRLNINIFLAREGKILTQCVLYSEDQLLGHSLHLLKFNQEFAFPWNYEGSIKYMFDKFYIYLFTEKLYHNTFTMKLFVKN